MQAITTHQNADFDALASLVAAGKLYPEAELVIPGTLNLNVREFVSLYKDTLQLVTQKDIDFATVNLLVVTDTRQKHRIGAFAKYLDHIAEIHLFDHHPDTDEDIVTDHSVCEEVGATTTILLEKIFAADIPLSPFEATLFALGIYEDTGALTFDSTTQRDAVALSRLWQAGVNLRVVNQFLNRPLSDEQRTVLDSLLSSTQYHELRGVRVAVATAESEEYVGGLSLLTHKIMEIEDVDITFSVVSMANRVYVVGRSRLDHVDLGTILASLNGKGHQHAASATLKDTNMHQVLETLVYALYKEISPVKTARDIMSQPVRTILPETTVDKARERMLRYGHSGFPVVEDGKLKGIISRRDLEKASHHGLGHAPVKGYMSKRPLTVSMETPAREIQQLMMEHNLGRLPVIEEGAIVGIVTRTDVLRNLEGTEKVRCSPICSLPAAGDDLTEMINTRLPKRLQSLLLLVSQKANKENVNVFAVGGFIRDLLLNIPNHDLDLVVEPAAIPFAETLSTLLAGQLTTHEKFGTATIALSDGIHIDLVTCRQEFYARPAALPEVEQSSLKHDLFRRDFTMNTLACSLNTPGYGKLIDLFNGLADLEKGLIRVLYNLSFVEDPLRVLRAIRFEQRFGFRLEETTVSLLENAAQTRVLDKLSKERLHDELALALEEENAPEILVRYFTLEIAPSIFPGVRLTDTLQKRLFAARELLVWASRNWPDTRVSQTNLYLAALLLDSPFQGARHLCRTLRFPREQSQRILSALEAVPRVKARLEVGPIQPSELNRMFSGQPVETLLLLQLDSDHSRVWESTSLYWEKLRHIQTYIDGNDLKALGFQPGPGFQEILKRILDAHLDGQVSSREEELALAQNMFAAKEKTYAAD